MRLSFLSTNTMQEMTIHKPILTQIEFPITEPIDTFVHPSHTPVDISRYNLFRLLILPKPLSPRARSHLQLFAQELCPPLMTGVCFRPIPVRIFLTRFRMKRHPFFRFNLHIKSSDPCGGKPRAVEPFRQMCNYSLRTPEWSVPIHSQLP